jgi:hypothetical protein
MWLIGSLYRNEPVWITIHIHMETTQGISLCSCLYFKLVKTLSLIIFYFFSSTKSENKGAEQVLPRSGVDWGGWAEGNVAQIM